MSRGQNQTTYQDQSDFFYANPLEYLQQRFPEQVDASFPPSDGALLPIKPLLDDRQWSHQWPSHLVLFEALLKPDVASLLRDLGYEEEKRIKNGHWQDDARRKGDIIVLRWQR